ncbi:MAG: N-acetylglucosaminyl-diphospho-decaprenol L-rhamnosyltransferase [Planctomycetota bacterium]|jgi:N-acetylglucosaminyl-diphospho-decaprenol L-rhamnosyltransferase
MSAVQKQSRRLSALIVNFNSGAWALRCVESLLAEWERDGRRRDDLEIIVLDSGSEPAESTWWRSLRRLGARVKSSPANVGYATGLNMAWEMSRGAPDDVVALLNPDLFFLPGSLRPLMNRLEEKSEVGAVAPRLYLDEERQIQLPQNLLPTPQRELRESLSVHFPRIARWVAAGRSTLSRNFWREEEPVSGEMLSGACLFLRRETVLELGEPMDGRYPLYFEDADLCQRLTDFGYRLETVPDADVLHHWSRCAGPNFEGEVAKRHAHSRILWFATHHSGFGAKFYLGLRAMVDRLAAGRVPSAMHELVDLGDLTESPEIRFPEDGEYVVEISLTPSWGLSAGICVDGDQYSMPSKTWSWLFPGKYYMRALQAESGACLGAWSFQKHTPARSWPLDVASLPAPRARLVMPLVGGRVG